MDVPLAARYTADQALARLKEGNARFVAGEARFPTVQKEVLAALATEQHPFATILGCSDSRVPPELLETPLFVVLGHESCGAVTAAVDTLFHGARLESRIEALLADITPGLEALDSKQPREALLHAAVEANVRHTIRQLAATPEAKARLAEGHMRLIGAVYEIESGRVTFLD